MRANHLECAFPLVLNRRSFIPLSFPNSSFPIPFRRLPRTGQRTFLPSERSLSLTKQDGGKMYLPWRVPWRVISLQFRLRTFPQHMIALMPTALMS